MSDAELARLQRAGAVHAREALIARHLPLARAVALRYRRVGEPADDLLQVASLALIKAVDRWDPDRGSPFRAFAAPTILGELRRYFRDSTWLVRPPRGLQELVMSVERERSTSTTGRELTCSDLAARLGRSPDDVGKAMQAARGRSATSLDSQPAEFDSIVDAATGRIEHGYEEVEARATVERLVPFLNERARVVVRLRFHDDLTLSEIAARLGVSQMQVSRILRRSLERMASAAAEQPAAISA